MIERDIIIGCGPYDRMASLRDGTIATPGYNIVVQTMNVTDIPRAAFAEGGLDVAEISLGELLSKLESGDRRFTGIPAFPPWGSATIASMWRPIPGYARRLTSPVPGSG